MGLVDWRAGEMPVDACLERRCRPADDWRRMTDAAAAAADTEGDDDDDGRRDRLLAGHSSQDDAGTTHSRVAQTTDPSVNSHSILHARHATDQKKKDQWQ